MDLINIMYDVNPAINAANCLGRVDPDRFAANKSGLFSSLLHFQLTRNP